MLNRNELRAALYMVLLATLWCSGQALKCFQCDLGFWDLCYTTHTNCSDGEQCFVGIGKAVSVLDIKVMGCLLEEDCNKTTTVDFPANKTIYTITKHCCDEDYCNGGPAVQMASITLLAITIVQIIGVL